MNRNTILGAAIIIVACLVFCSCELAYPFGRDQGNYAYAAWVWLDGGVLYRDVFVFKPPGTVFVHALAQLMFGHSMTAIRALDLDWTIVTALLIAAVARHLTRRGDLAVIAGVLYPFLYGGMGYWYTCQTDGWLNLFAAASLLAAGSGADAFGAGRRQRSLFLLTSAGVLAGVAVVFKYTAVVIAAPLLVILARERRLVFGGAVAFVLGSLLPLVTCAGWLWEHGAMDAFLDSQLNLIPTYVAKTGRGTGIASLLTFFEMMTSPRRMQLVLGTLIAGLVGLAVHIRRPGDRRELLTVLAWLLAGAVSCIVQNKYFSYHYFMMLPGVAILGALAASDICGRLGRARIPAGLAIAATLISLSKFPQCWLNLGRLAVGSENLYDSWSDLVDYQEIDTAVRDNLALAEYIQKTTRPEDKVFLWGFEPMVNFVAERKTVSRFLYNYPFAVSWGNPAYESELLAALSANPPTLFVVSSQDAVPWATGNNADSRQLFEEFTALRAFVVGRYKPEVQINRFGVFRLVK